MNNDEIIVELNTLVQCATSLRSRLLEEGLSDSPPPEEVPPVTREELEDFLGEKSKLPREPTHIKPNFDPNDIDFSDILEGK